MLNADKQFLLSQIKVRLLQIREKELHFYVTYLESLATKASILAGFGYFEFTLVNMPEDLPLIGVVIYRATNILALCINLGVVLVTMQLSILAPGKALRGPEGSMSEAVDNLRAMKKHVFVAFICGIIVYACNGIMYSWLVFNSLSFALVTMAILLIVCLLISKGIWTYAHFRIPKGFAITGNMELFGYDPERDSADVLDPHTAKSLPELARMSALLQKRATEIEIDTHS